MDRVLIGQSSESFGASSREQFYVSCSRGRREATVYTDEARRADPTPTLDEEKGDSPLQQSLRQAETRTPERETRDKDMER